MRRAVDRRPCASGQRAGLPSVSGDPPPRLNVRDLLKVKGRVHSGLWHSHFSRKLIALDCSSASILRKAPSLPSSHARTKRSLRPWFARAALAMLVCFENKCVSLLDIRAGWFDLYCTALEEKSRAALFVRCEFTATVVSSV